MLLARVFAPGQPARKFILSYSHRLRTTFPASPCFTVELRSWTPVLRTPHPATTTTTYIGSNRCVSLSRRLADKTRKKRQTTTLLSCSSSSYRGPRGHHARLPHDFSSQTHTDTRCALNSIVTYPVQLPRTNDTRTLISACSRRLSRCAIRVYRSRNALRPRTTAAGSILVPLFPTSRRVPTSFLRSVCPPCPPIPPCLPSSLPTARIARSRGRPPRELRLTGATSTKRRTRHDDEVRDDAGDHAPRTDLRRRRRRRGGRRRPTCLSAICFFSLSLSLAPT